MRRGPIAFAVTVALLVGGLASPSCLGVVRYNITDLGTFGGPQSQAAGINAIGQVVGTANTGDYAMHAFVYANGRMLDLGTLGGLDSYARAVNDSGQVVGYSTVSNFVSHAYVYSGGTKVELGTFGGPSSFAQSINNSGQVVGWAEGRWDQNVGNYPARAFLYDNGAMTDLGGLIAGGQSYANGINDSGQVVGYAFVTAGAYHAFVWRSGVMNDLGTLGGSFSIAFASNEGGQIVGWANIAGDATHHAFLYSKGTMMDLGTLGGSDSIALAVNSVGQVVGTSRTAGDADKHAFLYHNGSMEDLNDLIDPGSGWTLMDATGINDAGQIVGYGYTPASDLRAFLLTPVPEPTSCGLLAISGLGVLTCRRRA